MLIDFSAFDLDSVPPLPPHLIMLRYYCPGDDCVRRGVSFEAWEVESPWESPCCNAPVRRYRPPKKRRRTLP